jgi:hypothetical protein
MPSPFNLSSKSAPSNSAPQKPVDAEEFSIRTMKDDLENPEKFLQQHKQEAPLPAMETKKVLPEKPPAFTAPKMTEKPASSFVTQNPFSESIKNSPSLEPKTQTSPSENPKKPELSNISKALPEKPASHGTAPVDGGIKPEMAQKYFEQPPVSFGALKQEPAPAAIEIPASPKSSSSSVGIIITVILIILILIALGFGGYYLWLTKYSVQIPVQNQAQQVVEEAPVLVNPTVEKYSSSENPNYLSFDFSTITTEDIKIKLVTTANELREKTNSSLTEFVVVDANNNPVVFSIFAAATKMSFSPILLDALDENFSLYLYNDNGNMYLAVATNLKDKNTVIAEMLNQEPTFITDASFLFLNNTPQIKSGKFSDNTYSETPIRYINLDPQSLLSLDYAIIDSKIVIGTSKNTTRAVLDKLTDKKSNEIQAQTPAGPTETSEVPVPTNTESPSNTAEFPHPLANTPEQAPAENSVQP